MTMVVTWRKIVQTRDFKRMIFNFLVYTFLGSVAIAEATKEKDTSNSGRYTVKEEVQKAPASTHFCNLTRTSVKISFPEMKSRVFVNFLGYKEPNLVHLQRCKGRCGDVETESVACVPLRTKETKVKMMLKSFLTGPDQVPDQRVREMVLEEHLECGCACDELTPMECLGRFNRTTCECGCPVSLFGRAKAFCEEQSESLWNYDNCKCEKRSLVARGAGEEPGTRTAANCRDMMSGWSWPRRGPHSLLDIGSWILLGSCLALVAILAAATYHYRKKLRTLQGKEKKKPNQRSNNSSRSKSSKDRKTFFHDRDTERKYQKSDKGDPGRAATMSDMTQLERIAIENSLLLSGSGGGQLYHEQYDEHGVKIEYQCFK